MNGREKGAYMMRKGLVSFTLIFALLLSLVAVPVSAADAPKVSYLSLGDSLAAGLTSEKQILEGFSDYTANYLKENKLLEDYTKKFAVPGDTTADVLEDLTTNIELQEAVKKADVISISAGANDILKKAKIDASAGTVVFDPAIIMPTLTSIGENYAKILATIKSLNSDAKVYVIGTYYPFPHFTNEIVKAQLMTLAETLNNTVSKAVIASGATFVPIFDVMGGKDVEKLKKVLPNPLDIHPNAEGYKLISGVLVEALKKSVVPMPVPNPEPTPPIPKDLEGHWAREYVQALIDRKLLTVDENGHANPGAVIKRAEVAVILHQSLVHAAAVVPENPGFTDVPETHPAYQAIATLTSYGVFAKAEKFNPDAPLTRAQLAKVITLSYEIKVQATPITFTDVRADYWGNPFIQAVAANKLMIGFSNGQFMPGKNTTRAEFATVLYRALAVSQTN